MQGSIQKVDYNIILKDKHDDGNTYKIEIKVPLSLGFIERMKFITEENGIRSAYQLKHIKNDDKYVYFEGEVFLKTSANYKYYFSFEANKDFKYYKRRDKYGEKNIGDDEKWNLSINFDTPDWAKGKIMYHIFVDRFNRVGDKPKEMPKRTVYENWEDEMIVGPSKDGIWNADFYGGNLKGIEEKLDYIKSLGVSIIYLSPVVWSQSNHRYDASDYEQVDPYLGTNDDLKSLCDKAHEKGMKVVLDAVFNHTGNDSKYFNEYGTFDTIGAYQSKDSKYYNFYKKYYENNQTYFGYWWGMPNLPVCDGKSKEWQQYIYGEHGIIDKWFELGIDGLRLDVADELTDEFIEGIRKAVKRNKEDGLILGEVWKNPMRMNRGYISSGKGMDSVMNYPLVDALIRYFKYTDTDKLIRVLNEIINEYPEDTRNTLMNFTSTHDITRAITIFGSPHFNPYNEWVWDAGNDREWQKNYKLTKEEYERGKEIYKSYIFTLAFLPGILSIFYGDEIGLDGMGNLANRKQFPKTIEDKELLEFFRKIGRIRNEETFLEEANIDILDVNDKLFIFERQKEDRDAIVAINRTGDQQKIILPDKFKNPDRIYTINDGRIIDINEIPPHEGLVLRKHL